MLHFFKSKMFLRLFLSYVAFFIIPFFIINWVTVAIFSNSYESDIVSLRLEDSEKLNSSIEAQLAEINLTASSLSDNYEVWDFTSKSSIGNYTDYIYGAKKVSNIIGLYSKYKSSTYAMALYFPMQDCIVTANSIFTPQHFYDMHFTSCATFEEFSAALSAGSSSVLSAANDGEKNSIAVFRQLYGMSNYSVTMIAVVNIDNIISSHNMKLASNSGISLPHTMITNSQGVCLYDTKDVPKEINQEKIKSVNDDKIIKLSNNYFALHQKSTVYPLSYFRIFPYNDVSETFKLTKLLLLLMLFAASIIFLIISCRFTIKIFSPFEVLISDSDTNSYKIENYSQIQTLLLDLINGNKLLNDTVEKQRTLISTDLFTKLLQNSMTLTPESFEIMFENAQQAFPYKNYQIVIIRHASNEKDASTMLVLSILASIRKLTATKEAAHFVIPSSHNDLILLFNHDKDMYYIGDFLKNDIMQQNSENFPISIGIGQIETSINNISKSYEKALCSFLSEDKTKMLNVCYASSSSEKSISELFFTDADKNALKKELIDGNYTLVEELFDKLHANLFKANLPTFRILAYVCFALTTLLIEVIDTLEIHNEDTDKYIEECQKTFSGQDYENNFSLIRNNFLLLCSFIDKSRIKSDTDLRTSVINYINENYSDPNISLRQIAAKFHISYNYLCRFFKTQTGTVFLDYLHNLKMEKSKELLKTTNKSINEIASELGFSSANSFIRKFKAEINMSPGEYRKKVSSPKNNKQ